MPIVLALAAVAILAAVVYETRHRSAAVPPGGGGAPPAPTPGAACAPATGLLPGRTYKFAVVLPAGAVATAEQVAGTYSATGLWQAVGAWVSTDPSMPAYAYPAGVGPGPGVFLVRGVYSGPAAPLPLPGVVQGIYDCTPAGTDGGARGPSAPPAIELHTGAPPASPPAVALHTGGPGIAIAQAAQALLTTLGPKPPASAGVLPPLQWEVTATTLRQLAAAPTIPQLQTAVASLSPPSQGPVANADAEALRHLLTVVQAQAA